MKKVKMMKKVKTMKRKTIVVLAAAVLTLSLLLLILATGITTSLFSFACSHLLSFIALPKVHVCVFLC